jgi:hypothetical protein
LAEMAVDELQAAVRQLVGENGSSEADLANERLQRFTLLVGVNAWI